MKRNSSLSFVVKNFEIRVENVLMKEPLDTQEFYIDFSQSSIFIKRM